MFKKSLLRIGLICLLLALFCSNSQAVTLTWDLPTDNPIGIIIYFNEQGETDTPYNTAPVIHPATSVTIDDNRFVPGVTYDVWATAYNTSGESENSNIVEYMIDPFQPPAENLPVIIDFPNELGNFRI